MERLIEGVAQEEYDVTFARDIETNVIRGIFYRVADKLHRDLYAGPAVQKFDEQGRLIEERWMCKGELERTHAPALTQYDPETGVAILEMHFSEGVLSYWHGPAVITRDGTTGTILSQLYFDEGRATDGPRFPPEEPAGPSI